MQFTRKTSYSKSIIGLLIKLFIITIVFIGVVILLNKLEGFYNDLGWNLNLNPYQQMFFNI